MTRAIAILVTIAFVSAGPRARAGTAPITLGLFTPAAPFPSTAARVELANQLAAALGKAVGAEASARVYARAPDFAVAVKRGDVTLAVVDAAYLASLGGAPSVIAVAVIDDEPAAAWQVVAPAGTRLVELRGKRVLAPTIGGREAELVLNVLFGGDLGGALFAAVDPAPDTASALAALGLGRAAAAVVPVTGKLPEGTAAIAALPTLPNPALVVYRELGARDRAAVIAAALAWTGDQTITGFRAADGEAVRGVARRFAAPVKRAPFVVPSARAVVDALVPIRPLAIARPRLADFVIVPPRRGLAP